MKKYWYLFTSYYCPICGHDKTYRERQYTTRPEEWNERHKIIERWDGCDAF